MTLPPRGMHRGVDRLAPAGGEHRPERLRVGKYPDFKSYGEAVVGAAGLLSTSEQVVKNYLRTAFDKLGVWTRLELALYISAHGGASWQTQSLGGLLSAGTEWSATSAKPRFRWRKNRPPRTKIPIE